MPDFALTRKQWASLCEGRLVQDQSFPRGQREDSNTNDIATIAFRHHSDSSNVLTLSSSPVNPFFPKSIRSNSSALGLRTRLLLSSLLSSTSAIFFSGSILLMVRMMRFQLYGSAKAKTRSFFTEGLVRAETCRRAVSATSTNHSASGTSA